MIISPPFLPSQPSQTGHEMDSADAGNTVVPDHDVCAAGMQECAPGNGAYPVSYSLGWHGGPHLIAPTAANGHTEPVRAIADGKVVYVRHTSPDGTVALQYRNVRTDDGCVVIRHTTAIGEGDSAKVTFFSIYMHLQSVVGAIVVGKDVYRKDQLGTAGQIYGQPGQIHFEIVCNAANLEKLVGRRTGTLTAAQGRTDAIYGDIWFKVPKGTKIFANEPHPYRRDDSEPPLGPHPSVQSQQPVGVTASDLVIRMHFGPKNGECTLTTFRLENDGRCTQVGEPQSAHDYEYDLYKQATRLNAKYTDGSTAPANPSPRTPSPSLIYEMLRFGRPVGETMPSDVKFGHWRRIATPEGTGWVNLNQPTTGVYSDADFPHWAGWCVIDDDSTPESLCNSSTIRKWLDLDGDGHVTHAEAVQALHNEDVKKRTAKAICRFPLEWSKQGIDTRWGWLKTPHEALSVPLSGDDFTKLEAHIKAIAFWEDVQSDPDLPSVDECWHFPPKAFIENFRKCGWLNLDEITQLIPRRYGLNHAGTTLSWDIARGRLNGGTIQYSDLCKVFRKYGFSTAERQIALLSQSYIETGLLRTAIEDGKGQGSTGNAPYYTAFYGRGLMQLTWPTLYDGYGKFRAFPRNGSGHYNDPRITATSRHHWSGPPTVDAHGHQHSDVRQWAPRYDPDIVGSISWNACDSAGFFWFWKHFMGTTNILRIADEGITTTTIGRISVLVNGGGNGYDDRQQYAAFLQRYRGDSIETAANATLTYARQRIISHPHHPPEWGEATAVSHVYVDFTPQRRS